MKITIICSLFLFLFFCTLLQTTSQSILGIDVSDLQSSDTFKCIHNYGNFFAIIQATHSNGTVLTHAAQNLYNAAVGGLLTDVKIVPCRGRPIANQVDQLLARVSTKFFNTVWIEVMSSLNTDSNSRQVCGWTQSTPEQNCKYLSDLAAEIRRKTTNQNHVGIYTNIESWRQIFKSQNACPQLNNYHLWYSHDNKQADFSDFVDFGPWFTPDLKQYDKNVAICGTKVNRNYHPDA